MTVKELRDWLDKQEAAWNGLGNNFYITFTSMVILHKNHEDAHGESLNELDIHFDGDNIYVGAL